MSNHSPKSEYERRLRWNQEALARAELWDLRIANTRLVLFVLLVIAAWVAYRGPAVYWLWTLPPGFAFAATVVWHQRVLTSANRTRTLKNYYKRALDRLSGRWLGHGLTGDDFLPEHHPYAADLDILGRGSLFELLCEARTRTGQATLANWLLAPAEPVTVEARQQAVRELALKLDLREDLALLGELVERQVRPRALAEWASDEPVFSSRMPLTVARIAAVLSVVALIGAYFAGIWVFLVMFATDLIILAIWRVPLAHVTERSQEPRRELAVVAGVLARLEQERWQSPHLIALKESLVAEHESASRQLRRVDRLVYFLELPANQLFLPFAILTLWPIHVAYALESWRARVGGLVLQWLSALGEIEALVSLASYAYEHPADPFPTFTSDIAFQASGLAHPFLPENACVRNDIALGSALRLVIVSGSNMSGKSTLLRMAGVNAVLAQAGAPVRAHALMLSPCRIGATLHVQDSLQAGASRFYAEIARLKQVVDLADAGPTLFLFDEILSGTNSHDRRIGAAEILAALLDRGAYGMITTHDLALTRLEERFGSTTVNVHFTDEWREGRLVFPYRLRPGVVQQGNALRLMQSLGLPVAPETE